MATTALLTHPCYNSGYIWLNNLWTVGPGGYQNPVDANKVDNPTKSPLEIDVSVSRILNREDLANVWRMDYMKQVFSSIVVLQKIKREIAGSIPAMALCSPFHDFLLEAFTHNFPICDYNQISIELVNNDQDKALEVQKIIQASEEKKDWCKWICGSLGLIALIAGAFVYDTEVNGKGLFAQSVTGESLKKAGLLPYVQRAWYTSISSAARGYKWIEKTLPPYIILAGKTLRDLLKIYHLAACIAYGEVKNFVNTKLLPISTYYLDKYVPGLPEKIESTAAHVKNVSCNCYQNLVAFFQTQVFVGPLSPQNLRVALNQTQNLTLEYYNQFHNMVDFYSQL